MTKVQIFKGMLTYVTIGLICIFPFVVDAGFGKEVVLPLFGIISVLCIATFSSFYFYGGVKELKQCTGIEFMLDEEEEN